MAEALAVYQGGKSDGIGIVLGNDLSGIGLDHCRNPETSELTPKTEGIIAEMNSYTEVSHRLEATGYVVVRNPHAKARYWRIQKRRQAVYARHDLSPRDRSRDHIGGDRR
jgi:hypothetical protein